MATLQNIGKLKYRGKDGQWHDLPVVVQDADGSVSTISGKGAPTSATQGAVNQLYRDEDTQRLYICTATDGGYTWAAVSGGSVDVDATLTKAGYAADAKAAGDAIGKKIDAPQTAAVGEVLTVEEVDAEGKPKKWKTAPGVNITTELTQESTDAQVPSAKAAYDAIQNATDKDAVRFVAQELTDEQKEQARKNINATPKLYYWPNEKIASAVTSKYQTSNGRWGTQYEYNNILLSLPQNRNMFQFDGTNLLIIKTGTHNNIQFKIEISNSIEVARSEFKKYFGDLYFVTMVLRTDSQGYQIKNLYADEAGMTIDPVLIGMAEYEGKPGLIRINAREYDSATYNPLVMTESGYAVSYNEFSITTASDVGTVFRTQKAKAILVTGNIQKFVDDGFNAPYFMVQLSTEFDDGIITNDYMVMAPVGVFFARGVMNIRGTSNTVSWQINSDKFGLSLSIINGAFNNLYANSLRPPTTAQPGQIVRVKAVDADGKITETEAVDMPISKSLRWITVHSSTLAEETTEIVISTDGDGNAIASYNPIGLTLILSTPADATQTDNNGTPWVYPSATKEYNDIRVIGNISGWKTVARDNVFAFYGGVSAMICAGNVNAQLATYRINGYALDGVRARLSGNTNHFPAGTHVEVSILCEVPDANVSPA